MHVGAACPPQRMSALKKLLKPSGGIIVTPVTTCDLQRISIASGCVRVETLTRVRYSNLEVSCCLLLAGRPSLHDIAHAPLHIPAGLHYTRCQSGLLSLHSLCVHRLAVGRPGAMHHQALSVTVAPVHSCRETWTSWQAPCDRTEGSAWQCPSARPLTRLMWPVCMVRLGHA